MPALSPRFRILPATCVLLALVGAGGCGDAADSSTSQRSKDVVRGADAMSTSTSTGEHEGMSMPGMSDTQGLTASEGGYRLVLDAPSVALVDGRIRFQIHDAHDRPVHRFAVENTKRLHLILVRRDFMGYQHLHPTLGTDGTWSVTTSFASAGMYRLIADFTPVGADRIVLGTNLQVGDGKYAPTPLHAPASLEVVDGFEVHMTTDGLRAGHEGTLTLHISKGGSPPKLEPYLGARGHGVVLRSGDFAYLHVHPTDPDASANELSFEVTLPTRARYVGYIQFQVAGKVHLAIFTLDARHGPVVG